ncbi:MAG: hypothetical protein OCD76_19945 [Reichenbachiella sp.]
MKTKKKSNLFPRFLLGIATAALGVATYAFVKNDKMHAKNNDIEKNGKERLFV